MVILSNETWTILDWCRNYQKNGPYKQGVSERFLIGLYQVYQGFEWQGSASADESFAAAALHFTMVAEYFGIHLTLPTDLRNVRHIKDSHTILMNLSRAAQMVIYGKYHNNTGRKSRFSSDRLCTVLTELVGSLLSHIEPNKRLDAIETAASIMGGKL